CFDVPASGRVCELLERKGHPYQLVIVPRASEQLNVDRLAVIVVPDRERDGWNSIGCARRVAATEAPLAAAAIVQADVAQESRIDHGIDAEMIGAGGVHPHFRRRLTSSPIVSKR